VSLPVAGYRVPPTIAVPVWLATTKMSPAASVMTLPIVNRPLKPIGTLPVYPPIGHATLHAA